MVGLGLSLRLGGGAALSEAAIAAALAAKGMTDAQARAAIAGAVSLAAGLRAVGLLPAAPVPPVRANSTAVFAKFAGFAEPLSNMERQIAAKGG